METAVIVLIVGVATLYIIRRIHRSVKGGHSCDFSPGGTCSSCGSAAICDCAPIDAAEKLEKDKIESC